MDDVGGGCSAWMRRLSVLRVRIKRKSPNYDVLNHCVRVILPSTASHPESRKDVTRFLLNNKKKYKTNTDQKHIFIAKTYLCDIPILNIISEMIEITHM